MNLIEKLFIEIKEIVVYYMEEFPITTGLTLILIGFIILKYQLKKNNSFKLGEYRYIEWRLLISVWAIIVMLFSSGLILIFK